MGSMSPTSSNPVTTLARLPGWVCVALGGALGALARWALTLVIPHGSWGWATTVSNLCGAALLGAIFSAHARLSRPKPDGAGPSTVPAADSAKLLLGTGFCGAFTTYSTLIADVVLTGGLRPVSAAAWLATQLALGILAAFVGSRIGEAAWSRGPSAQAMTTQNPQPSRK